MYFRIDRVEFPDIILDLALENKYDDKQNYCTIIIGKNGVGKSRLLQSICDIYLKSPNHKLKSISTRGEQNASMPLFDDFIIQNSTRRNILDFNTIPVLHTSGRDRPNKLLVVTSSPFDRFPIHENSRFSSKYYSTDESFYHYLGTRNSAGFSNRNSHINRIIETLIKSSTVSEDRRSNISEIFETIGLSPEITIKYRIKLSRSRISSLIEDGEEEFFNYLRSNASLPIFRINPDKYQQIYKDLQLIFQNDKHIAKNEIHLKIFIDNRRYNFDYTDIYFAIKRLGSAGIISISSYEIKKSGPSDQPFDISQASSGQQALLLLFLGIGSTIEDNSLIIIDEPEISLHPEWQENFMPLLAKIFSGFNGCHFILATHSPLIISQASDMPCTIISLDDLESFKANEYSNNSSDFQLVEIFETPGYKNEYLSRICLNALQLMKDEQYTSENLRSYLETLKKVYKSIHNDDPIKDMVNLILSASEIRENVKTF